MKAEITKKTFLHAIDVVMKMDDAINTLYKLGFDCADSPIDIGLDEIVAVLEKALQTDMISWWLWDAPNAGKDKEYAYIIYNDKRYDIQTAEQLFDFICLEKEYRDPDERLHNGG